MMSIQTWSSISVYDFFRTYNWTGETTEIDFFDSVELVDKYQSLFSLNLKDFLGQSNWTGHQENKNISQEIQPSNESVLSLSVNNFFRGIGWEKRTKIAPTSNNSSFKYPTDKTSSDLDLNNLSDLF